MMMMMMMMMMMISEIFFQDFPTPPNIQYPDTSIDGPSMRSTVASDWERSAVAESPCYIPSKIDVTTGDPNNSDSNSYFSGIVVHVVHFEIIDILFSSQFLKKDELII